jgi:hypothetical protein
MKLHGRKISYQKIYLKVYQLSSNYQVTVIFGQAPTSWFILNQIDTNNDRIPIFFAGKLFVFYQKYLFKDWTKSDSFLTNFSTLNK